MPKSKWDNVKDKLNLVECWARDGLTDKLAFEYVHSIGGKNIFITSNEKSKANYQKLNINQIIDECFDSDFGIDSKISKYIEAQIVAKKDRQDREFLVPKKTSV